MPHVGRPVSVLFRQHLTNQQVGVPPFFALGRAQISSEMRDAIANLQSLYQCHERVFSDGPSEPSNVSRRTGGRALNLNHQPGARLSAVVRRRTAALANKITRSLPLHITVVQGTLHVKALTTVRIHQWMWLGQEYQLRIICWSCRRKLVVSSNAYTICVIAPNKRGRSVSFWSMGAMHPSLSIGRPIEVRFLPTGERASSLSRPSG